MFALLYVTATGLDDRYRPLPDKMTTCLNDLNFQVQKPRCDNCIFLQQRKQGEELFRSSHAR